MASLSFGVTPTELDIPAQVEAGTRQLQAPELVASEYAALIALDDRRDEAR